MTTATTAPSLEQQLSRLEGRLDEIADELARQRTERQRWSELAEDMAPVARRTMASMTERLEEVADDVSLERLGSFALTFAHALPRLEAALRQIEPLAELSETVAPLARPAMDTVTDRLAELERRGYFDFTKAGFGVVDRVVTSFSDDDVEALGDNIVLILQTVKEMTQPEVMQMLRRTFETVQEDEQLAGTEPPGLFALVREMRSIDVRRGLNKLLHMLRSVGAESAPGGTRELE